MVRIGRARSRASCALIIVRHRVQRQSQKYHARYVRTTLMRQERACAATRHTRQTVRAACAALALLRRRHHCEVCERAVSASRPLPEHPPRILLRFPLLGSVFVVSWHVEFRRRRMTGPRQLNPGCAILARSAPDMRLLRPVGATSAPAPTPRAD